ncbi:hypothetical protein Syun_012018 [Stephania yunnanensis]|uniref:Uncharacterized protein n=1 Tax=Stephania yunnanensis TaxID=152371 RepID=A0AAP0JYL3_9MAGN
MEICCSGGQQSGGQTEECCFGGQRPGEQADAECSMVGRQVSRPRSAVCGCLIVAWVKAGRLGSHLKLESAGLLPRLNDFLPRRMYSTRNTMIAEHE